MTKEMIPPFNKRNLPREVRLSVQAGRDKKAEDIVVLDLRELSTFTDFFVIMTGNSTRQNTAISESIEQALKKTRVLPLGVEGRGPAEWILLDYGSYVVHVFSKQARAHYSLEKLWGDAPRLSWAGQ
ncbi:MAG: ribosome silencing factor [Candidatus Aminicenantales bacterium]